MSGNGAIEQGETFRVLFIEDDHDYANYIRIILSKLGNYDIDIKNTMKEAQKALHNNSYTVILSDLGLPDSEGLNIVRVLNSSVPNIPVIVLSNIDDDQMGIDALKMGAADYISKKNVEPPILHRIIIYSIERNRMQIQLDEQTKRITCIQKFETIGTMVGTLSHKFNNILTVIQGYSSHIMIKKNLKPLEAKEWADQISKATSRASKLIEELELLSKTSSSISNNIKIDKFIRDKFHVFQNFIHEGINIQLKLDAEAVYVSFNRQNLVEVIGSILSNAKDAIPDQQGTIELITENYSTCPLCDDDGEHVAIKVKDNGEGISEDLQNVVWDPFFTTKENSAGLGLSNVINLVRQQGGCADLTSNVDEGTTVKLYLPQIFSEERERSEVPETTVTHGSDIVVIEDDWQILELIKSILENNDYNVITVDSPSEVVNSIITGELNPSLVISDVIMPGMNGLDLVKQIRDHNQKIPIFLISGYAPDYYSTDRSIDVDLLKKPFTSEQLLDQVDKSLSSQIKVQ